MTSVVTEIHKLSTASTDCSKKSNSDDQIDVKTEFKCAIDETLTTVCHVASISDLSPEDQQQKKKTEK